MNRRRSVRFFMGMAIGVAIIAIPFIFRHMPGPLAAVLFDGGSIIAVVSLILLLVELRERRGG